jgi:CRISPR-associated endonuclease/helicase Cas3
MADYQTVLMRICIHYFLTEIASEAELDNLFSEACQEVATLLRRVEREQWPYTQGMLTRVLLSIVVDADRWDTACFEKEDNPFREENQANWNDLSGRLERHLSEYGRKTLIGEIRGRISDACSEAAACPPGIYTLTMPTGGGKTLSSLRYAFKHAVRMGNRSRIFYIIPFNTILEQNSDELRRVLDGYTGILEHYGVFTSELEGDDGEQEEREHLLLTERWDAPIIMTSMVQFLDTLYRVENTCARRLHRLAGAVLIFDEIQALPKRCRTLFEIAVQFLVSVLDCTVLLCTATQPKLRLPSQPLLPAVLTDEMTAALKRTCLINDSRCPRDNEAAARDIAMLAERYGSVLIIVNTKAVAAELFSLIENLKLDAECIHLSTNMCPAHRLDKILHMKKLLKERRRIICVSTMLIEAGVDISFPCVVRSLSGLPSILQAAGRCNRHMDWPTGGDVYIWHFTAENLGPLTEISKGRNATLSTIQSLAENGGATALDAPEALELYLSCEEQSYPAKYADYLWDEQKNLGITLTDMLSFNHSLRNETEFEPKRGRKRKELQLFQAFRTAGHAFRVIDNDTINVLTPYGEGKELAAFLCAEQTLQERIRTLRKAQLYSVAIRRNAIARFARSGILYPLGETGLYALREEHYDDRALGLNMQAREMGYLHY